MTSCIYNVCVRVCMRTHYIVCVCVCTSALCMHVYVYMGVHTDYTDAYKIEVMRIDYLIAGLTKT